MLENALGDGHGDVAMVSDCFFDVHFRQLESWFEIDESSRSVVEMGWKNQCMRLGVK